MASETLIKSSIAMICLTSIEITALVMGQSTEALIFPIIGAIGSIAGYSLGRRSNGTG